MVVQRVKWMNLKIDRQTEKHKNEWMHSRTDGLKDGQTEKHEGGCKDS